MPDTRDSPGPLVVAAPRCPLCEQHLAVTHLLLYCYSCRAAWHSNGTFRDWLETFAGQCGSKTVNPWSHTEYQCYLNMGHAGFHKHPTQGPWRTLQHHTWQPLPPHEAA